MLEVFDLDHDVHVRLAVFGAGADVANVGFRVADYGGDLFQHSEAVIAENGQLDRECRRNTVLLAPLDVNPALGFVHQVAHIGALHRVHGHALAARYVTDSRLAANRIATARAIDQQIAVALYAYGVAMVSAKDASNHAADRGLLFKDSGRRRL